LPLARPSSTVAGDIHTSLKSALDSYVCTLEESGVNKGTLLTNLHLQDDPFDLHTSCGTSLTYLACNNQNQCVQMAGKGVDSCSVANQVTDCDLIRPTATANPLEGTYTTTTASGESILLTVTDNTGGSGLNTVKWILSTTQDPQLAKTSGTAITPVNGSVIASPIPYPTTTGVYYLNVYAIDKGKTPNELYTNFGPYNVSTPTGHHSVCKEGCFCKPGDWGDYCIPNTSTTCNPYYQCVVVNTAGTDNCSTSSDCERLTHNICDPTTNQCITVDGGGLDQCTTIGATCSSTHHMACNASNQCVSVSGAGADTCTTDSNCTATTHKACSRLGMCTDVAGAGIDSCATSADCRGIIRPPRCIVSSTDTCSRNNPNSICYHVDAIGCNNDPWPGSIYQTNTGADIQQQLVY
jgi:hypothetical protein